jgi:tetratricopeptide (TPR) repeat protein
LANPLVRKYQSVRVSELCLRSAYLHYGNALRAASREADARVAYEKVLPMLVDEPRSARVDWERCSIYVNIGNTYSAEGNHDQATEQYQIALKLGQEHVDAINGARIEGIGMTIVAQRAMAFALKKAGKEADGKKLMAEVLKLQMQVNEESAKLEAEKSAEEQRQAAAADTQLKDVGTEVSPSGVLDDAAQPVTQ